MWKNIYKDMEKHFTRKHLLTGETKSLDAALDEAAAFS